MHAFGGFGGPSQQPVLGGMQHHGEHVDPESGVEQHVVETAQSLIIGPSSPVGRAGSPVRIGPDELHPTTLCRRQRRGHSSPGALDCDPVAPAQRGGKRLTRDLRLVAVGGRSVDELAAADGQLTDASQVSRFGPRRQIPESTARAPEVVCTSCGEVRGCRLGW